MTSFVLKNGHVMIDGVEITKCTCVELKNINPGDKSMEIVIHADIEEIDIKYNLTDME